MTARVGSTRLVTLARGVPGLTEPGKPPGPVRPRPAQASHVPTGGRTEAGWPGCPARRSARLPHTRVGQRALHEISRVGEDSPMQPISKARFDILAGYARRPGAEFLGKELAWLEAESGRLLAVMILDTDSEFSGILFARDLADRFRAIGQTDFYATLDEAGAALDTQANAAESELETLRVQGDEGRAMNFFEEVEGRKLHEHYAQLNSSGAWTPARSIVENVMRWYEDGDGNFVEQFQTGGFDARVWEVYVFLMLVEQGYIVTHPGPAPDFLAERFARKFTVEATTVNPSLIGGKSAPSQKPQPGPELAGYLNNYLPIRYAGRLIEKLNKEYWLKPEVKGHPLLFAIQDFHDQMSMTYSGQALQTYLYGQLIRSEQGAQGVITRRLEKIAWHEWGTKQVQSGFFELPGAEHVSAILFNGAGTLPKFDRIGLAAGFGSNDKLGITHHGTRFNPDDPTKPLMFNEEVLGGTRETWTDGLWVFHNPKAVEPFDPDWLLGAAHVHWDGSQLNALIPEGHLDSSFTTITFR